MPRGKKKSGVIVLRGACRKKERKIDPAQFGATGPQGPPGIQGPPGTTGQPGAQGPMGPALVVKDANGAFVGFLTSMTTFGGGTLNDIQVTVARQAGDAVVTLDADASGFLMCGNNVSHNLYYTTSDCSGPPVLVANDAPTLVAVACLDPTTQLAYYPTGTGTSVQPAALRAITVSGLGGCQTTSSTGGYYAPASTLDVTTLAGCGKTRDPVDRGAALC